MIALIETLAVVGVGCFVVAGLGHMSDHNNRYPLPLAVISIACFGSLLLLGVH